MTFSIFHVNDVHAHFEEVDVYTGRCRDEQAAAGECYGGAARMFTKAKELQDQEDNWIFLNAGDYYQVCVTTSFYWCYRLLMLGFYLLALWQ